MIGQLIEAIPTEQWIAFLAGLVGFLSLVAYGSWKLFDRWFNQKLDIQGKQLEASLEAKRVEQETKIMASQFERDETLFNQETMSRFFKLLEETTKTQQHASDKRDEQHNQHMEEIAHVVKSLDGTTASQLELLKEGQESHQVLLIRQEKITAQNEVTHSKLSEITSDLSALSNKIENLTVNKDSDRRTLEGIHSNILSLKSYVETLNNKIVTQPLDSALVIAAVAESSTIAEQDKELSQKTNEDEKD